MVRWWVWVVVSEVPWLRGQVQRSRVAHVLTVVKTGREENGGTMLAKRNLGR